MFLALTMGFSHSREDAAGQGGRTHPACGRFKKSSSLLGQGLAGRDHHWLLSNSEESTTWMEEVILSHAEFLAGIDSLPTQNPNT